LVLLQRHSTLSTFSSLLNHLMAGFSGHGSQSSGRPFALNQPQERGLASAPQSEHSPEARSAMKGSHPFSGAQCYRPRTKALYRASTVSPHPAYASQIEALSFIISSSEILSSCSVGADGRIPVCVNLLLHRKCCSFFDTLPALLRSYHEKHVRGIRNLLHITLAGNFHNGIGTRFLSMKPSLFLQP
jgi:hypothetical protein